jgi:hypothetical protein
LWYPMGILEYQFEEKHMPSSSRSESEYDSSGEATAAPAEVEGRRRGPVNMGALAGFRVPLPGVGEVNPMRLLWWGGLAALAAVEVVEWPVALMLGAGSYVAEYLARDDVRKELAAHP